MRDKLSYLLKPHKGMKPFGGYCQRGIGYDLEYQTEVGEEEVIITAAIRIKAKTKKGKKILNDMAEKQTSPLKTMIQKVERENKIDVREGKGMPLYPELDNLFE